MNGGCNACLSLSRLMGCGRMGSTSSLPVSGRAERQESWDLLKQPGLLPCSTSRWDHSTQNLLQVQWEDCTTKKNCFVVWVCGLRHSRAMWVSLWACNPPGTESGSGAQASWQKLGHTQIKGATWSSHPQARTCFNYFVQYMISQYHSKVWGHVFLFFLLFINDSSIDERESKYILTVTKDLYFK